MQIKINNIIAEIKKGTSFDYIVENRTFTESDTYTLNITFPLKGSNNITIFGAINRIDKDIDTIVYDCEISDRNFYKKGVIVITEITKSEIKAQFLADRCKQNYDTTFDDIYINDLDLGKPFSTDPKMFAINQAHGIWKCENQYKYVAIPWVNTSNESPNINNEYDEIDSIMREWNENTEGLSFMPYLIYIAKQISLAIGFDYDFDKWENSYYRNLIVCNVLPYSWNKPDFAAALPHWSVSEFFHEIEKLMNCELTRWRN